MTSQTALMFNLVNEDNEKSPGLLILNEQGIVQYLNEEGSRLLNKKAAVKRGDNIFQTPLA
ncbi:hypothetical protein, partial [Pseudomonas sp. 2822-17]|uniref:hypothetical protein n=1 Tax=Pseudomonas sp. 2822-17 TaxID=1712678 RepID=UPI001179E1E7